MLSLLIGTHPVAASAYSVWKDRTSYGKMKPTCPAASKAACTFAMVVMMESARALTAAFPVDSYAIAAADK